MARQRMITVRVPSMPAMVAVEPRRTLLTDSRSKVSMIAVLVINYYDQLSNFGIYVQIPTFLRR